MKEPNVDLTYDSWIDFGEPITGHIKLDSKVVEVNMIPEDFYWSAYNTAIAIGDIETNAFAYTQSDEYGVYLVDSSMYSIFDSGISTLNISTLFFESLIENMFNYAGISATDWTY